MRSIVVLNEASNLKICWDLCNSEEQWAIFLRDRVMRGNRCIRHHIFSYLWSSFKHKTGDLNNNTLWMLGNDNEINFWTDRWCDAPLVEMLQLPDNIHNNLTSKFKHFISDGRWTIPKELQFIFPNLMNIVQKVIIPYREKRDTRIWSPVDTCILNLKVTYAHCSTAINNVSWGKIIWNISIPPFKITVFLEINSQQNSN